MVKPLIDAQQIWAQYHSNFAAIYAKLAPFVERKVSASPGHQTDLSAVSEIQQQTPEAAARVIQKFWFFARNNPHATVGVVAGKRHSNEFRYFLNHHTIRKSLHKEQLAILKNVLGQGRWNDPIFRDKQIRKLALTLFQANNITAQQFYSVLEYVQNIKDFPYKIHFSLLSETGKLTPEAKLYLADSFLIGLNEDEIRFFELLLAELPCSEQFFYLTERGPFAVKENKKFSFALTIQEELERVYLLHYKRNAIVHLLFGAQEALRIVKYGLDEVFKSAPRIGEFTVDTIEEGVRNQIRPAALSYDQIITSNTVHEIEDVPEFGKTAHDKAHADFMSATPNIFIQALQRMVDLGRRDLQVMRCKEFWVLTDADFDLFFERVHKKLNLDNAPKVTQLFCDYLMHGSYTQGPYSSSGYLFNQHTTKFPVLTPLGVSVFLDMLINPSEWLKWNINPNYLRDDFAKFYQCISNHCALVQNYPIKVKIFIFQVLTELFKIEDIDQQKFERLLNWINNNGHSSVEEIAFHKLGKNDVGNCMLKRNILVTTFNGKILDKKLIESLFGPLFANTQRNELARFSQRS